MDVTENMMQFELWRMIVGSYLGSGLGRTVYECATDPAGSVIKVEDTARSFQNQLEWEVWQHVKDTPNAKWFAPCLFISPSGSVLVQARTQLADKSRYPKKMPAFLTDFKRSNFGLYQGRIVAHDYGVTNIIHNGLVAGMREVSWWEAINKDMPKGWRQ